MSQRAQAVDCCPARDMSYPACMYPSTRQVADVLRELGVAGDVRELPEPAPAAAVRLGGEDGAIL